MKTTGLLVFIYGLLILVGGLMGHYKAASCASLTCGLVFGCLLIGSSLAIFLNKNWGQWAALILALILDGFFTWRFSKTLSFMPAGLLSLLSLVMIIILALRIRKTSSR
jgi:uncharacterized membrane protein (UPF0136 family)